MVQAALHYHQPHPEWLAVMALCAWSMNEVAQGREGIAVPLPDLSGIVSDYLELATEEAREMRRAEAEWARERRRAR